MDLKAFWDDRFTQGLPSLEKPDPFFLSMYEQYICQYASGGKALDLAAGLGRHALYLADHQWHTTAVDISAVAIEKLKARNLKVDTLVQDIADYDLPASSFDLIVLYYHFDRALFPKIFKALKPGGLFICKLAVSYSGNLSALQKDELLSLLTDFELISHTERPVRDRGVVEYLGKKQVDR